MFVFFCIFIIGCFIAYAFGPIIAGMTQASIGFQGMNLAVGFLNVCYAPLLIYRSCHTPAVKKTEI